MIPREHYASDQTLTLINGLALNADFEQQLAA
jgi:hypothetical protein